VITTSLIFLEVEFSNLLQIQRPFHVGLAKLARRNLLSCFAYQASEITVHLTTSNFLFADQKLKHASRLICLSD